MCYLLISNLGLITIGNRLIQKAMLPEFDLELTLEQQFQLQLLEKELATVNQEKLKELVLKTSHLLMLRENVIRSLTKKIALE